MLIQCDSCDKFFDEGDIGFGPDPYAEEICGDATPMWLCNECYSNSAMDI